MISKKTQWKGDCGKVMLSFTDGGHQQEDTVEGGCGEVMLSFADGAHQQEDTVEG
jgi:hypothetical protein